MQKLSVEKIGTEKVYYHLHCQENADKTSDIKNTQSHDLIVANKL